MPATKPKLKWRSSMRRKALELLREHYHDAKAELIFASPLELLIAVVLSAQSTDQQVNSVTIDLFKRVKSAAELACIPLEELMELIKGVGLYRTKAKNLKKMGRLLLDSFDGEVPKTFAELESLPGVGHKTASVVLSVAFDIPALAVDTHVFRVANRTGMAPGKNVIEVEEGLKKLIPKKDWASAHHWLLHHGRYCCRARSPLCSGCIITNLCKTAIEESDK